MNIFPIFTTLSPLNLTSSPAFMLGVHICSISLTSNCPLATEPVNKINTLSSFSPRLTFYWWFPLYSQSTSPITHVLWPLTVFFFLFILHIVPHDIHTKKAKCRTMRWAVHSFSDKPKWLWLFPLWNFMKLPNISGEYWPPN